MLRTTKLLLCTILVVFLAGCNDPPPFRISTQFNAQGAASIAQAPYLLPQCFKSAAPSDLKLVIHAVGTDGIKGGACNISASENNTDFSLHWSEARIGSKSTRVAEITVKSEKLYSDNSADRTRFKDSFSAFQQSLAALEEDKNNDCLKSGDAQIISQRIANALPLRIDELLAYNYGLDSGNRVIDLQAGMRLRIEYSAYQFIDPEDDAAAAYVGGGSSYLHVTQRPDQTLAFEPYLGSLKAMEAAAGSQKELGRTRMISGAMGLAAVGVSRRYARLVYPDQYPTIKNTSAVTSEGELPMRVGLLLADSAADLATATEMYLGDSGCAATQGNSIMCFYFSGQSFVIPELLVKIQGTEQYVPVGTTLRDAFNRYTVTPVTQIGNLTGGAFYPQLKRWLQPAICPGNPRYQPMNIKFENNSPITASRLSQWDMPFLKGDELLW